MDYRKILQSPEYSFLSTEPRLGDNVLFLVMGGSHAYGTNTPTSDIDVRGCAMQSASDLIGLSSFEQFQHGGTDTVIYAFNKFVHLACNCNPNIIEMLGCLPEHYLKMTPIGEQIIANRRLFLSKRSIHSFGGYATQQLRRLENALVRNHYPAEDKERHIMGSCNNAMQTFPCRYKTFSPEQIRLYLNDDPCDVKIMADVSMLKMPLREFIGIMNELTEVAKNYDKLNHRNSKKDDNHLNKHAMHLVRLYLEAIDIFEKGDIITHRKDDLPLLRKIRAGEFQNPDHSYRPEFFDIVSDLEKRFNYAVETSDLPKSPDMKTVEEFVFAVNKEVVMNAAQLEHS